MADDHSGLARGFDFHIRACEGLGSRFSAQVMRIILSDIEAGGPFAALAAPWAGWSEREVVAAAAPLRLLGGLHFLTLSGQAPALAAQYPGARVRRDAEALHREIVEAGRLNATALAEFIRLPPQTNEVRRSLCLVGGFLTVARETGLPLRCLEIGTSAGLNLNWDLYRYEVGGMDAWGDPDSPLVLDGDWSGDPPPFEVKCRVAERAGCDRAPIDVSDPDQALRLEAYVWADQPERQTRLKSAIAIARRHPPAITAEDAGAWALARTSPQAGVATVLFHSVVWSYLSAETRDQVREAIHAAGRAASAAAPFAWLRMEPVDNSPEVLLEVKLTLWPGGEDRRLAFVHPHGAQVVWRGG